MSFADALSLINYTFVLFFGVCASFELAGFPFLAHKKLYLLSLLGFGSAQLLFYLLLGETMVYRCYPFLIHLPLILLIHFVLHRNLYFSFIAVLSAYLLCTPRKWLGTLVSFCFDDSPVAAYLTMILVTIPLLFIVIHFFAPYIAKLKYENKTTLLLFFLLPLGYYVVEYTFTVYTDLLYTGGAVVVEFTDSFIVMLYFILSMLSIEFSNQKNQAERENLLLTAATQQAKKEIAQLSDSQKQASIYRHDLRHHMNFLQNCIQENKTEEALSYIQEICSGLTNTQVTRYCSNDSVNLILSSYVEKATAQQVNITICATASDFSRFQITDLCSLLANGLENALHACEKMPVGADRYITLKLYEKNSRLCIKLSNSYASAPVFENDIPISSVSGHGIGVQSMVSVVDRYQGVYGFFAEDGEFRFQASM